MRFKQILCISLAVRILQTLLTSTFFQPDEFFQALEPAHQLVFGYGHLTWEWRCIRPIRSIIYPAVFVPAYWLVKVLGLEHGQWLVWAPKITQGVLASITDVAVCRLARRMFGPSGVKIALLLSLTSFFHGLALVRTFSNSMETSLTTLALSYWLPITNPLHPKKLEETQDSKAPSVLAALKLILPLSIAAFACAIRPTNAVLWTYLVGTYLFNLRKQPIQVAQTLFVAGLVGAISILAIIGIDSWYYHDLASTFTFTALNFLRTNLSSVSLFYGDMPWHYYLTQAYPILLTTCLPFFFHGVTLNYRSLTTRRDSSSAMLTTLTGLTIWTTAIYSLAGHKEWRFLHPLLPIMHLFCTKSLLHLTAQQTSIPPRYLALLLLQIPAMVYVTFFHGRAQIAVMHYLRSVPSADLTSVGFLMPCHSTPWQAYLHRAHLAGTGRMWALGCEPPLGVPTPSIYVDQTNAFYKDPKAYLAESFPQTVDPSFPSSPHPVSPPGLPPWAGLRGTPPDIKVEDRHTWQHEWPEHLVMFGALLHDFDRYVEGRLRYLGYRPVWRTFNGFEEDERRRGGVEVWRWNSTLAKPPLAGRSLGVLQAPYNE